MIQVLLIVILTLFSAFFALSQISLFSLTTVELRLLQNPFISKALAKPRDLLVTLLFCDIFANIMIQNSAASLFGKDASWVMKVAVPLGITVLFCEVLPKTAGLAFNRKIAPKVAPIVGMFQNLLNPLLRLITFVTTYISQALFFFLKKDKELSNEEVLYVLESSEKSGLLNHDEAQLVQGFFSLSKRSVKERMHPRLEILSFDIDSPLEKLIDLFVDKKCTRVPVYQKDLQNILGICHARDFFLKESASLIDILKKPFYVPESLSTRALLRQFLQKNQTLALVVDEYGSISGLITKEDVMEIVVGEIADSRDQKPLYTQSSRDTVISSGRWELAQFEKVFFTSLPSKNNLATIGGWLTEQMGEIPKTGACYHWKNFQFQVLSSSPNRIRTVYIKRRRHES